MGNVILCVKSQVTMFSNRYFKGKLLEVFNSVNILSVYEAQVSLVLCCHFYAIENFVFVFIVLFFIPKSALATNLHLAVF